MEQSLILLESGGKEIDHAVVNRLLQATRAMRAVASQCQLAQVRHLAQRTERALAPLGAGRETPAPERVTALLRAIDTLRAMIDDPDSGDAAELAEVMRALDRRPRPAGWRFRALLVEDDFTGRLLLQTFLSRYGDCHLAVNGREAVAAFRAALEKDQPYDLICMDIMMPEMDGGDAVRAIRALEEERGILPDRGAKIVMTTAVNDLKEVMRCFHRLCDEYLVKPIDLAQLLGYLKEYELVAQS
jgi:two-component system chemotaxis response regulator CheY